MTLRKDVEKLVKVREFHRTVEQLLTPEDRDYLFYALKEYNTYKSVAKLMLALNSCLDTPEKLDLLPYVRDLIPKHDQKKFDSLAPYNRMAHPFKSVKASSPGQEPPSTTAGPQDSVRTVLLQRPKGTSLGFSIRGGREHDLGIYVSHVDSFSLAEKSGLQVRAVPNWGGACIPDFYAFSHKYPIPLWFLRGLQLIELVSRSHRVPC